VRLPENHPRIIRELAEHGYIARSGNKARFELATEQPGSRAAYLVHWTRKPSEADKAEFERIAGASAASVTRGPDLNTAGAESVAAAVKRFLEGE
jgi:hypothetical protein